MQIVFQPYKINTYQQTGLKTTRPNPQYKISQLALDTYQPNFCGLKKSAFEGIDYYVVNKYKAPIEKFKNLDAFFAWAEKKCNEILNFNYGGRRLETENQRIALLKEWKEYFEDSVLEEKDIYLLCDIMKLCYTTRTYSDMLHRGAGISSNTKGLKLLYGNDTEYNRINKEVLPKLFNEVYALLS